MGRTQKILKVAGVNSVGVSMPQDKAGNHHISGTVIDGPASMIGRRVEIEMSRDRALFVANGILANVQKYPEAGKDYGGDNR